MCYLVGVFSLFSRLLRCINGGGLQASLSNLAPEVAGNCCGESDVEYIEKLDAAETDITGAINMALYGIVNC